MKDHIIKLRDTDKDGRVVGPELNLDLTTGWFFDDNGNQVRKIEPLNDDKSVARDQVLADYAREESLLVAAHTMSLVSPERATAMLRDGLSQAAFDRSERADRLLTQIRAADRTGQLVKMDLGTADVHIPTALPNFASGYRNMPPIADMVSPPLLTPKSNDKYFQFPKEDAFQRATPLGAVPGGQVAEISTRPTNSSFTTVERALAGFVSTQLEANADVPLRIAQATTKRVLNALTLEREIRVANLATTSANYDASVVTTLLTNFQWNGGASSDPVKNIHDAVENAWGPITGIGFSLPMWHAFVRNPAVQKFTTFKDSAAPLPGPQQIAALLDLPTIYVGRMQYMDTLTSKKFVWGNNVALFCQPEQMPPTSQEDVATSYTFRWDVTNPPDGQASGGFVVRQFFDRDRGSMGGLKIIVIHHDAEVITSKFAAGLIVNAIQ